MMGTKVNAQNDCACSCCMGNYCTPSALSPFTVSTCDGCTSTACTNTYATSCPSSTQSGSNMASCSSSTNTNTNTNTNANTNTAASWTGNWKVQGGCDQTQCCCLSGTFTVASQNNGAQLTATSPVAGQCGTATTTSFTFDTPTTNSFTATIGGQSHTLTVNGNTITDANAQAPACGGFAVRSAANSVAARPHTIFIGLIAIIAIAVGTTMI